MKLFNFHFCLKYVFYVDQGGLTYNCHIPSDDPIHSGTPTLAGIDMMPTSLICFNFYFPLF